MTTTDENKALTRVRIANTAKTTYIAEQFKFAGRKTVDVRVHVCDALT